jgi:hypothetical protein
MIESEHFFAALHVLSEVLPYQKQLSPETRGALWELFPPEAKRDLTAADLQWAVSQRLIDPNPPREMAISFVFLHYLYPKRDGWPALDAGPRRRDPQTAVRDEQKVFRADEYRSLVPPGISAEIKRISEARAEQVMRAAADGMAYPVGLQAIGQDACDLFFPEVNLRREIEEKTRIPSQLLGAEGPDGPWDGPWSEPNWQGSGRHG